MLWTGQGSNREKNRKFWSEESKEEGTMCDELSEDQVHQVREVVLHGKRHCTCLLLPWALLLRLCPLLAQLFTSFQLLDGDKDGWINATDLQRFMGTFNSTFTLLELEEFIRVHRPPPLLHAWLSGLCDNNDAKASTAVLIQCESTRVSLFFAIGHVCLSFNLGMMDFRFACMVSDSGISIEREGVLVSPSNVTDDVTRPFAAVQLCVRLSDSVWRFCFFFSNAGRCSSCGRDLCYWASIF